MWMIFNKSVQTVARRDAITKKLGMQRVIKKEAGQRQWMDGIANGIRMGMEMGRGLSGNLYNKLYDMFLIM